MCFRARRKRFCGNIFDLENGQFLYGFQKDSKFSIHPNPPFDYTDPVCFELAQDIQEIKEEITYFRDDLFSVTSNDIYFYMHFFEMQRMETNLVEWNGAPWLPS